MKLKYIRFKTCLFIIVSFLIIVLVLTPLVQLFFGSISEKGNFTFKHWTEAFNSPLVQEAIFNTIFTSVSATIIATVVGVALALIISYTDIPFRNKFEFIFIIPLIIPPFLGAMAWDTLGNKEIGLINMVSRFLRLGTIFNIESLFGLIFVLAIYTTPFVFLTTSSVLKMQNPAFMESAKVCGSRKFYRFFHVLLPLVKPGIISGTILAFITSTVLFGVHSVIGMPANIFLVTTVIYRYIGLYPINFGIASVLALILLIIGILPTYAQIKFLGRKKYVTITGKGFKPSVACLGKWKYLAFSVCLIYLIVSVFLPYFVLLFRSLNPYVFASDMSVKDIFSNWSLKSYKYVLFDSEPSKRAFINSIILASLTATSCVLLSMVTSYIITRTNIKGRGILNILCTAPLAIPGIVLAVGLIWAYSTPPLLLYGTFVILLIAYITKGLPFASKSTLSSFLQVDSELEEVARVSGASWIRQFYSIILPLIKPGILVAWMIVFCITLTELGASIVLFSYGNEVIGTVMYSLWDDAWISRVSAIAIITMIITLFVIFVVKKLTATKFEKMKEAYY